ncbi:hypothetical protein NIES37_55120 [Tolypothrix tenuis PCC 7101]|uniref:Uncharacterized protein n=1 Tax=Tolypothrix tenuis PCC 7101 TaxID=231146 RepID=A0A1Z4N701_9CYAN|nr:hypothetical protein NIES37_55120 [Tolypothrix tenuis PCC 7101]BAZ74567.1 hypothetical protein NIES50_31430 [Aulosira laxa NIES-50]
MLTQELMTKDKAQSRASRVGGFPDLNELALSGGNLRSELCKNDSLSQLSLISPTYLSALHSRARQDISK